MKTYIIIAIIVLGGIILGVREKLLRKREGIKKLEKRYGKIKRVEHHIEYDSASTGYFRYHIKADSIDDITFEDFSMDSIFNSFNITQSQMGEEVLYSILRNPVYDISNLEKLERDVKLYQDSEKARNAIWLALNNSKKKKSSLYDYIDTFAACKKAIKYYRNILALVFITVTIALLILNTGFGIGFLVFTVAYNVLTYLSEKTKINPYLDAMKTFINLYQDGKSIVKSKSFFEGAFSDNIEEIEKCLVDMKQFTAKSKLVFSVNGNVFDMLKAYFDMLFHFDLIIFYGMIDYVNDNKQVIDKLFYNIGYMEAMLSVASLRTGVECYCIPVFDDRYEAKDIYHLLIDSPVKNSFKFEKSVLLTGTNASGKSTFLRTVGINQILAQTINTCLASSLHTSFFRIYSSMALHDNIYKGDSYYMVEIKAMKRIIDACNKEGNRVLCFVDEILRGTNTVERIAACKVILRNLASRSLAFAATHDVELTKMLANEFDNYHFGEMLCNDKIEFPYILEKGPATSRNAIRLLHMLDYDADIVDEASKLVDKYLERGSFV